MFIGQIKYLEAGRCSHLKYLEAGRCQIKYLEAGLSQIKYLEAGLSLNTYYYVLTMNAYKSRIYLCILSSFMDGHVQYYDSILTKKEGKGHK